MDGSSYLLDTNIVIAVLNQEPPVLERLNRETVYLASIVLGELYYGAYKSARVADNLRRLAAFVAGHPILNCDQPTAERYGRIKTLLAAKGRPLPDNDLWIAAMALQHSLTLVTRDEHFNEVDGLALERW